MWLEIQTWLPFAVVSLTAAVSFGLALYGMQSAW